MQQKKEKQDKNSTIDNVIKNIAAKVDENPDKEKIKDYLGSFNVTFGIVEDTVGTYKVIDVLKYPGLEIYMDSAAAYSVRNKDVFRDYIMIEGADGKKANVKGEFGNKISLARKLKIAFNILKDRGGNYIVKTRGLPEKDQRYKRAMKALNEYTEIIEEFKRIDGTAKLIDGEEVKYYKIRGEDVLEEIDKKELKNLQ